MRELRNRLFGLSIVLNLLKPNDPYYFHIERAIYKVVKEINEKTGQTEVCVELPGV